MISGQLNKVDVIITCTFKKEKNIIYNDVSSVIAGVTG